MRNAQFKPSVRYLGNLQIYFVTKASVQVRDKTTCVSIVRWDKIGGGRYAKAWRPFCQKLQRRNELSLYKIINLATRYGLMVVSTRHPADPPDDIWIRPSKFIYKKGKKNGTRSIQTNKG